MNATLALLRVHARDVLRSRWLAVYGAFFLLLTEGLLRFSDGATKAVLALGTVIVLLVPLVTLVLATVYLYGARDFMETLLAQPVGRGALFRGVYLGLTLPLAGALLVGAGIPLARHASGDASLRSAAATLLMSGVLLTASFTAIACCIALGIEDRLRGLSVALATWLVLAVLYDGAVLAVVALLADKPLETPLLALTFANPIDLARVLLLLDLDTSALMGYTGAAFERFFAGAAGALAALAALTAWTAVPVAVGARRFRRKDF